MPSDKPLPLKVHKLNGTFRKDRHGRPSIAKATASGLPKMPRGMKGAAKNLWELVIVERRDWLAVSDGPALQTFCELWELRCRTLKKLDRDPTDKDVRCSFTSYQQEWSKMAARFGMTPADRAKLGENSESDLDPAAKYVS